MDLAQLISRRFWIWVSVLLATVGILLWFVPAVMKANQKVPEHVQVGLQSGCVDERLATPQYGDRGTVPPCAGTR